MNFTIVNYNLNGSRYEMRDFHLADLNLCNRYSWPSTLRNSFRDEMKFGTNFIARCVLNLQRFIDNEPESRFSSLHLRVRNVHATFLQTVPTLIHNAFEVNGVSCCRTFFSLFLHLHISYMYNLQFLNFKIYSQRRDD